MSVRVFVSHTTSEYFRFSYTSALAPPRRITKNAASRFAAAFESVQDIGGSMQSIFVRSVARPLLQASRVATVAMLGSTLASVRAAVRIMEGRFTAAGLTEMLRSPL